MHIDTQWVSPRIFMLWCYNEIYKVPVQGGYRSTPLVDQAQHNIVASWLAG